jgi:hypothetical protein
MLEGRRVTTLVAAPRTVAVLAEAAADAGVCLSGLRTVLLLRDRPPVRLAGLLGRVLAPDIRLLHGWGAAEAGVLAGIRPLPLGDSYSGGVAGVVTEDGQPPRGTDVGLVEALLEEYGDVRLARVASTPEGRHVAFVEATSGALVDVGALDAHLRDRLPADLLPLAIVSVPAMPLTPTGVVDRARLAVRAELLAQRALAPDTVAALILRTIADELGIADLRVRTNLFEAGAGSMEIIRAVGQIEIDLDFDLDFDELLTAPYVQTVIDQYHARRALPTSAVMAVRDPDE